MLTQHCMHSSYYTAHIQACCLCVPVHLETVAAVLLWKAAVAAQTWGVFSTLMTSDA